MSSAAPLLSLLDRIAPKYMTTTEQLGRAMIKVARDGFPKPVLESEDINASEPSFRGGARHRAGIAGIVGAQIPGSILAGRPGMTVNASKPIK